MKRKILVVAVVMVCAVLAGACSKEHQCKCVTTDVQDDGLLKLLVLDGGMACSDVKVMGVEEHVVAQDGSHTLQRTEMHEVSCRDYAE